MCPQNRGLLVLSPNMPSGDIMHVYPRRSNIPYKEKVSRLGFKSRAFTLDGVASVCSILRHKSSSHADVRPGERRDAQKYDNYRRCGKTRRTTGEP